MNRVVRYARTRDPVLTLQLVILGGLMLLTAVGAADKRWWTHPAIWSPPLFFAALPLANRVGPLPARQRAAWITFGFVLIGAVIVWSEHGLAAEPATLVKFLIPVAWLVMGLDFWVASRRPDPDTVEEEPHRP